MMPPLPSTTPSTALSFASVVITAPSRQGVGNTGDGPCTLRNQRLRPSLASGYRRSLRDRPSINSRPCRCPLPQSDKSDFHDDPPTAPVSRPARRYVAFISAEILNRLGDSSV